MNLRKDHYRDRKGRRARPARGGPPPTAAPASKPKASARSPRARWDPGGGVPRAGSAGRPPPRSRSLPGGREGRGRGGRGVSSVRAGPLPDRRPRAPSPPHRVRVPEPPPPRPPRRCPPPERSCSLSSAPLRSLGPPSPPLRRAGNGGDRAGARGAGEEGDRTAGRGALDAGRAAGMASRRGPGVVRASPGRRPQSRPSPGHAGSEGNLGSPGAGAAVAAVSRRAFWDDAPRGAAEPGWRVPGTTSARAVRRSPRPPAPAGRPGAAAGGYAPAGLGTVSLNPGARYLALSASLPARGRRRFKDLRGLSRPADAHEGAPGRAEGGTAEEGRTSEDAHAHPGRYPAVPPTPAPPVRGKSRTERGHPASLSASGPKGRGPSASLSPPPSARSERAGAGVRAEGRSERGPGRLAPASQAPGRYPSLRARV